MTNKNIVPSENPSTMQARTASSAGANGGGPFAALRYAEFRVLIGTSFLVTVALLVQEVALGYELYRMTRDPLVLGMLGLAEAIPFMLLALFGGHLADRREKRRLIQLSLLAMLCGSLVLVAASAPLLRARLGPQNLVWLSYGVIMLIGFARGIYSPAMSSLRGFTVPREHYANASAWAGSSWQAGAIAGPASAGLLLALLDFSSTLMAVTATLAAVLALTFMLRPRSAPPAAQQHDSIWASLREGLAYVWRTPIILYSISLDMFSVLFGGVVAILPVFAQDVLAVGPEGLGILRAAPAVGALPTMLLLAFYPPTARPWRNLLLAVLAFGLATLLFALSPYLWLSALALALTGAFDSISVVIRGTVLQTMTPDHLRGRVLAVNGIFLSASNELGAFESGVAARLLGAVRSVIFGGSVTLLTVGWIWRRSRGLFSQRLV